MEKLFRRSLFGGWKKKDVESYVSMLEAALEEAKKEKSTELPQGMTDEDKALIDASIEEIKRLQKEKEELGTELRDLKEREEEWKAQEKDRQEEVLREAVLQESQKTELDDNHEIIKKMLRDAKFSAELIVLDANQKAENILNQAKKEAEDKRELAYTELQKEMERKIFEFITMKYQISEYIAGIEKVQKQLQEMKKSLQIISEQMPAQIVDLLKKEDARVIDSYYDDREVSADNKDEKTDENE